MFDTDIRYAVLGLARSGIAAAYKIRKLGGTAFLSDTKPREQIAEAAKLEANFECEFGAHSDRLLDFPVWIISPGIPLTAPIVQKGIKAGIEIIGDIEFGYRIMHKAAKIIAVTGSNGKSTTVSLIHHCLDALGHKSILAGNIGDAICNYPIEDAGIDYIVLELSSFQLDTIQSFKADVALLLNITPDHLDRYKDFNDYAQSKMRVFLNQTAEDKAVICADSEPIMQRIQQIRAKLLRYSLISSFPVVQAWMDGNYIQIGQYRCLTDDLIIKGPHNHANFMAAMLTIQALGLGLDAAIDAAKSFPALPHRLEYVAEVAGVSFYNDSKATNTDSVRSALISFGKPIRVIMGGSDKGEDFGVLTDILSQWALKVYICGDTEAKMLQAWQGKLPLATFQDFSACVQAAFNESLRGDIVLLSPAAASFDRFQNYQHRGEVFKQIVQSLVSNHEKK
ncbi:MAG TPA: UDP-N-acetylmuramoyl-L-alanine--D-glutamate ligase [Candidatus Cloacimonadota bacterium]|nr:UDP-N-acetylmuramoyl-L-alanine--D-glutamate ligase [Candidatus Cloacimonadota bacterium]